MTDQERKAMQMALGALLKYPMTEGRAIQTLRQALEQPEQEPVAWMYTSQYKGNERYITRYQSELTTYKAVDVWPLYTAPPKRKWQGLTDEEIVVCGGMDGADNWVFEFANAIQIKLREKNRG